MGEEMMDTKEIKELAYEMQSAYTNKQTQGEAIEQVKDKFTNADLNILWAMWAAIDAYCDINTG